MEESESEVGEDLGLEVCCHLCCGFEFFQFLRFFYERVDDVCLSSACDRFPEGAVDLFALPFLQPVGFDLLSAGREFVYYRDVQVSVERECEGSGDRGCGHHEDVGCGLRCVCCLCFLSESCALHHPESVLLIYDNESEFSEVHALLYECLCADDEVGGAVCDGGECCVAFGFREVAFQEDDLHVAVGGSESVEHLGEVIEVLFCEDFGGDHERALVSVFDGAEECHGGDDRFSGADIALYESVHHGFLLHIVLDFSEDALLCACELIGEGCEEGAEERRFGGVLYFEGDTGFGGAAFLFHLHAEAEEEEFLEGESFLCGFPVCIGGREVDFVDSGLAVHESLAFAEGEG